MESTPKIQRKVSLSLGRVTRKRQNSKGPSNPLQQSELDSVSPASNRFTIADPQRSPSVVSLNSDYGTENTPPHKKLNFDDSIEYSPKPFNTSHSPTFLLSQTLAIDSPEVGWRWGRTRCEDNKKRGLSTPDSAYAADSSFTSSESTNGERHCVPKGRYLFSKRREEQRRVMEQEIRRAEKSRETESLKKRCAKIQKQLNDSKERGKVQTDHKIKNQEKKPKELGSPDRCNEELISTNSMIKIADTIVMTQNDTLEGFLNDSEVDDLLLAATQQIESKVKNKVDEKISVQKTPKSHQKTTFANSETPKLSNKEKRSSLYMKFLEDDADDFFASLDYMSQNASETNKLRSPFQRYNSMPIVEKNGTTRTKVTARTEAAKSSNTSKCPSIKDMSQVGVMTKLKRHASSHVLSPSRPEREYTRQIRLRK